MHTSNLAYRGSIRSSGEELNVCIVEEWRRALVVLITKSFRAIVCLMRELSNRGEISLPLTAELFRAFTNPNLPGRENFKNQSSRLAGCKEVRLEEGFLAALGRLDRAMQEHVGLIHNCLCLRKIIPWECYLVENYACQIRPLLIKFARQCVRRGCIQEGQESDSESTGRSPDSSPPESTESPSSMDILDSTDLESVGSSYQNRWMWRLAPLPGGWDQGSALASAKAS